MTIRVYRMALAASGFVSAIYVFAIGLGAAMDMRLVAAGIAWLITSMALSFAFVLAREALHPTGPDSPGDFPRADAANVGRASQASSRVQCASQRESGNLGRERGSGAVIIQRKSQYINRLRDLDIYLDGQRTAPVGDGKTIQLDVDSGRHGIQIRIDYTRSPIEYLDVRNGEEVRLECGSEIAGWKLLVSPFLAIKRESLFLRRIPN